MRILNFRKIKKANLENFPSVQFDKKVNGSWENFKQKTYKYLLKKDFSTFLNWPIIKQTMFVDKADYLVYELNCLENNKRFLKILSEDLWGSPTPSNLEFSTSGNRIHHTYLLAKYELETNKKINQYKTIFEFGGGYGSIARLIHRLDFEGIYIIFDFDIFNIVQYNYLEKFGYDVFIQPNSTCGNGIYLFNDLNKLHQFLNSVNIDLFIATWSLSESDLNTRSNFKDILVSANHYLIAFQSEFDSINNLKYFHDTLIKKNFEIKKFEHMGAEQNYLFI